MVVCDPPDEWDDRSGAAASHEAGQLLDNMLHAVGKDRQSSGAAGAYVTNVVKCKPPHGYVPQPQDLLQCASFLQRELALVQPKLILALGRFACQLLLSELPESAALPLGKQRGRVYRYQGIPVVVSYGLHDLLRRGSDKAKAWADLCLALQQSSIHDNKLP
jgi:DNA polymerase